MDIIIRPHFFGGKKNNFDEIYVPLSIKSVIKYNPDSTVYFISNDHNFIKKHFSTNLKCFHFDDFDNENIKIFEKYYTHLSHNPPIFEKYSILGYIYIYNLMCKLNIEKTIIVETDVLIFTNLNELFLKYYDINNIDVILANCNTICCSYATKIYFETFMNTTLKMYSDNAILECLKKIHKNMNKGGICDMTINDWIKNENVYGGIFTNMNSINRKIKIIELSKILPDYSFIDNSLQNLNYENDVFDSEIHENRKKIYTINNKPYFKYKDLYIKCNSIHFQGRRKEIMPIIFNMFFENS